jgi:hypothetical protein
MTVVEEHGGGLLMNDEWMLWHKSSLDSFEYGLTLATSGMMDIKCVRE